MFNQMAGVMKAPPAGLEVMRLDGFCGASGKNARRLLPDKEGRPMWSHVVFGRGAPTRRLRPSGIRDHDDPMDMTGHDHEGVQRHMGKMNRYAQTISRQASAVARGSTCIAVICILGAIRDGE